MRREYVIAAGGNPDSPFVPILFYVDTWDDPRWYMDNYEEGDAAVED